MGKRRVPLGARRIVIIHSASILAPGLEMMLKEHGLAVTEMNPGGRDVSDFLGSLEARDVVIVDSSDLVVRPCLAVLQQLVRSSDVMLICLDPGESNMEIYRKEQRALSKLRDLVEVIQDA